MSEAVAVLSYALFFETISGVRSYCWIAHSANTCKHRHRPVASHPRVPQTTQVAPRQIYAGALSQRDYNQANVGSPSEPRAQLYTLVTGRLSSADNELRASKFPLIASV